MSDILISLGKKRYNRVDLTYHKFAGKSDLQLRHPYVGISI